MAYTGSPLNTINAGNWWDAPLQTLPGTQAPQLDTLSSVPMQNFNVAQDTGGFGDWFNNSGVFGKTLADGTKVQGWGMPAIGAAQGLASSFLGYQQYKLAKDTLEQNKRAFQLNFDAQKQTTNAALEDRQRARVASNPGAYQSVGDYMNKYAIKG